jgi:hypothetical protein
MKLNRSSMIAFLVVVPALCTAILLSGCASTGRGKDTAPEQESSQQVEEESSAVETESTAVAEAEDSSPEVRQEPVVYTGGAEEKPQAREAAPVSGEDRFQQYATSIKEALDRLLPGVVPEMNWNRIATVLVGMLVLLMIYGLAFWLGRRPLRSRGTSHQASG